MFYLTMLEKQIISAGMVMIFIILTYLLFKWFLKNRKKMIKTEMLTLNMVIKFKKFLSFLDYQNKQDEKYILYLVSIDNLDLLEKKYNYQTIRAYLRRTAKNLSMHLPYGGKLAQTEKRNTFILYIPKTDIIEEDYAQTLKHVGLERFYKDNISIMKNINITYLNTNSKDISKDLDDLSKGLVQSIRNLGAITPYENETSTSISEYKNVLESLQKTDIKIKGYDVTKLVVNEKNEFYTEVFLNQQTLETYIRNVPIYDQAWVNLWLVELILSQLEDKGIRQKITIPILYTALEKENFNQNLETLTYIHQYIPEQTIISLKESHITNQQKIVENLLELKDLGYQISYQVNEITPNIYIDIQSYHVSRLEVEADILLNQTELLDELLYFAKVNQIEVLVRNNQSANVEQFESLNVTHVTQKATKSIALEENKKRRGRK